MVLFCKLQKNTETIFSKSYRKISNTIKKRAAFFGNPFCFISLYFMVYYLQAKKSLTKACSLAWAVKL